MPWNNKVIWSEGLFLQPQHFQQQDRYFEKTVEGRTAPLLAYSWGFRNLELDPDALLLGKVQFVSASGIFPDGTPFDFPYENTPPLPLDIGIDARDEFILLALPLRRAGMAETGVNTDRDTSLARFMPEEREIADSNADANTSAFLQVGQLSLRLMRKRDCDLHM